MPFLAQPKKGGEFSPLQIRPLGPCSTRSAQILALDTRVSKQGSFGASQFSGLLDFRISQ